MLDVPHLGRLSRLGVSFICIQSAAVAAVAAVAAAVRHRVPDGQICCWFIESDPSVFFSFKRDLFLMHPLAILCRIYGLDSPTSSVIKGMRAAKAGVILPRRSSLVYILSPLVYIYSGVYCIGWVGVGWQRPCETRQSLRELDNQSTVFLSYGVRHGWRSS